MQLKTILNRCHKFKSFVYDQARFVGKAIEVTVLPRANAKAICSHCEEPASVYDHLAERRFEFIPIWGYRVFFLYRMRRVDCRECGVKVERVPWARASENSPIPISSSWPIGLRNSRGRRWRGVSAPVGRKSFKRLNSLCSGGWNIETCRG